MKRRIRGFTLIEVAIVTLVLTLLLGGLLIPLAAQVDQRRYAETKKALDEIKDALIGFAQVNGRLPCPAPFGGDGKEIQSAACDGDFEGDLPSVTLNVAMHDAWGNRFRYRVFVPLTVKQPAYPTLDDTAKTLRILNGFQKNNDVLADQIVAVVVSHGKNGFGANAIAPPANTDEARNADGVSSSEQERDRTLVARTRTDGGAGCSDTTVGATLCEFDDLVVWISPFVLFNRMSQAGHFGLTSGL